MKFNSETGSKAGKISKRGSALPIDLRGGLIDLVNRILTNILKTYTFLKLIK